VAVEGLGDQNSRIEAGRLMNTKLPAWSAQNSNVTLLPGDARFAMRYSSIVKLWGMSVARLATRARGHLIAATRARRFEDPVAGTATRCNKRSLSECAVPRQRSAPRPAWMPVSRPPRPPAAMIVVACDLQCADFSRRAGNIPHPARPVKRRLSS
jgi:hypothetical protein